jgi:5-methylcytosine-specific restriction endonuclease McrA
MSELRQVAHGEEMICNYCEKEFKRKHFNQRLCSSECKELAIKRASQKYKKTEKGVASEMKWRANPIKKEIDKKYMQTPDARKKAVIRATRCLANSPELQEKKRLRDKAFAKTPLGREYNKKASKKYSKTIKGKAAQRAGKARRRALENNVDGSFTKEELILKFKECGDACVHCGTEEKLSVDHIVPLKLGGTNYIENIQPLCTPCNSRKGARHVG